MRSVTKTILFALTALLLFASMFQKQFNWPFLRQLSGVIVETPMPDLSFQSYRDGSFQLQTEQYLKQHFGFRESLIRLYNQYLWDFYGKTKVSDEQIAFGKDGWLYEPWSVLDYHQQLFRYYAADSAQMASMFSEEAQRLLRLQQILEPRGIHLFVCMTPAKDLLYPEYLPENQDTRLDDKPKFSARFFYEDEFSRLGVNHLNLEQWFMQIKDSVDYMPFPKTAMHWSRYAALQAADTLIRYMEHLGDINMKNLVIGPGELHNTIYQDCDLEALLNLMRPMPKPKYLYAHARTDNDSTAQKPKMILIGDSFWWNIADQIPRDDIFSAMPYWYYNSTVNFDERYHSVSKIDLAEELLSADFIVLSYCATQQYRMNDGFTINALKALEGTTDESISDSTAFVQQQIIHTIASILTTPEWMETIRKQAEQYGMDIEQAVRDNAKYYVENQLQQLTTKQENHGIQ